MSFDIRHHMLLNELNEQTEDWSWNWNLDPFKIEQVSFNLPGYADCMH